MNTGKLIMLVALVLLIQLILYFGSEIFETDPRNVETFLDRFIPFIPGSAIIYIMWFPLIALFPIFIGSSEEIFSSYMTSYILNVLISVIIYLLLPTGFTRPVPPEGVTGRLMKRVYKASFRGLNCAPSLHCSSCMLIMYYSCISDLPMMVKAVCFIIAFLIIFSTLTTKQHTLIDMLTAIPMAFLTVLLGRACQFGFLGAVYR